MRLINDLNLSKQPLQLQFARTITEGFPGYYHAHQGMEFLYVLEGQGDVFINRKMYTIRPGTLLYFQPYQLHRIRMNVSPETPYKRSKLSFEPSVFDAKLGFAPGLQAFFRQMWKQEIAQPVLYLDQPIVRLDSLIEEYAQTYTALPPIQQQEAAILFLIDFFHILQSHYGSTLFKENSPLSRGLHLSELAMEWLEHHLHEPFELDRMAADLHVSKHHLSRIFKRATGSTLSEYLTIIRIHRACHLLETSEKSIEHISQEIGIANTSYFCEIFRNSIGYTPLQYRKYHASVSL